MNQSKLFVISYKIYIMEFWLSHVKNWRNSRFKIKIKNQNYIKDLY